LQQRSACEQHRPVQVVVPHWVPTPELAPALEPLPGCPDPPALPEPGLPEVGAPELGAPDAVPVPADPEELPALDAPELPEPEELPETELPEPDPVPASSAPNTKSALLQPFAATNAPKRIVPADKADRMRFMKVASFVSS
jgi:hypothetical protein